MNPAVLILRQFHPIVRLWLLRELVAASLFPVFLRMRAAQRSEIDVDHIKRWEMLFLRIVNQIDCYPYRVEWHATEGPLVIYIPDAVDRELNEEEFA